MPRENVWNVGVLYESYGTLDTCGTTWPVRGRTRIKYRTSSPLDVIYECMLCKMDSRRLNHGRLALRIVH